MTDWSDQRFRAIDNSVGTLARQMAYALSGMFIAFAASKLLADRFLPSEGVAAFVLQGTVFTVFGSLMIFLTSARPIRKAITLQRQVIGDRETSLRLEASRHRFSSEVQDALEMSEYESEALGVVSRAFVQITSRPAELLIADSSRAHLRQAAVSDTGEAPGCAVETPWGCPAVRRGQTLRFSSALDLSSCPRMRERETSDFSATCVPVTVLGIPMGVIHVTDEPGRSNDPDQIARLETIALQAGSRLGILRAMTASQLQAATDPLTGAVNRRSLEHQLNDITTSGEVYSVVLADLDHFKRLNDTFGHDTGDRALRLFVDALRSAVRTDDIVCRWGGEEFVLVLPGLGRADAEIVVERCRNAVVSAVANCDVPRFTASFGVADSTQAPAPDRVVRLADVAMFAAKAQGRDTVVVTDATPPTPAPNPNLATVRSA